MAPNHRRSLDPRIRMYGSSAVHVELATLDEVLGLHAELCDDPPSGLVEALPGIRTLLVSFDPCVTNPANIVGEIRRRSTSVSMPDDHRAEDRPEMEIPVCYDGEDLPEIARLTGSSSREVARRHRAATYVVALIGFAPGFYFLTGGDPMLRVPRRPTPRTTVSKGAVGLAGELTGIYPRAGPGGWQLVGHTAAALWDSDRTPSALLAPGTRIRFVEAAS
jgi:KipI family sensor histidine kinase inhibitor